MALPALQYRKITPQVPAGNTVENLLDAIWAGFETATYADATTRTKGVGSAWSMTRYRSGGTVTEAVYGTPPSGAVSSHLAVILAGVDAGAPTPTMRTPDTFAIGQLLVSLCRSPGAFNAWDNAAPFTTGDFFGYWRSVAPLSFSTKVHIYESQEDFWILIESATGTMACLRVGASLDPLSTDPADADLGGRLYAVLTSSNTAMSGNLWDNNGPFEHSITANTKHHGVFTPGTTLIRTLDLIEDHAPVGNNVMYITRGGSPILWPAAVRDYNSPLFFVGRMRETMRFGAATVGQVIKDSGAVTKAYLISGHNATTTYLAAGLMH